MANTLGQSNLANMAFLEPLLPLCSLSLSGSLVAYVYGRPEEQFINMGDFS